MKALQLASLLLFVFLTTATSCEDDEDIVCLQSDWVGTYSGVVDCAGDAEDLTLTITADGADNIVISYETPTTTVNFTPLAFNSCSLETSFTQDSLTVSIISDLTGGETLNLTQTIVSGTTTSVCNIAATRN